MKVVFLDVDGVLNNTQALIKQGIYAIDSKCANRLLGIIKATSAKIVLSSTWRLYPDFEAKVMAALAELSIDSEVIGKTDDLWKGVGVDSPSPERHDEISKWLSENPSVERYAIIDDTEDACISEAPESYFRTRMESGLTAEIANRIVEHLNGEVSK